MPGELSTDTETAELLAKANEIAELFQRAAKLGYTIVLKPEQLKPLIAFCERLRLYKPRNTEETG